MTRSAWMLAAAVLAGCAGTPGKAPVEERTVSPRPAVVSGPAAASGSAPGTAQAAPEAPSRPAPGAENAGKPGYYTVKPGDALIRIGLEVGQNWRDIQRWNNIENPNLIEVGQVLRVVPPGVEPKPAPAVAARPAASTTVAVATPVPVPGVTQSATSASPPVAPSPAAPTAAAAPRDPDEDLVWAWPAAGPVAAAFEEGRTKGLAISGKAGDPVLAAADGRVVYAGSGLRGYGNLVIIKHNATYLTAYAHNQALLVKEDQAVRRGQRIAEMGASEADRVQLHFEIRRQGKPVDPARLLPSR